MQSWARNLAHIGIDLVPQNNIKCKHKDIVYVQRLFILSLNYELIFETEFCNVERNEFLVLLRKLVQHFVELPLELEKLVGVIR